MKHRHIVLPPPNKNSCIKPWPCVADFQTRHLVSPDITVDTVMIYIVENGMAIGRSTTYVLTNPQSNISWIASKTMSGNSFSKKPYRAARKLVLPAQLLILHLVMDQPAHYLDEIQSEFKCVLLIDVNISTIMICRFFTLAVNWHVHSLQRGLPIF